MNTIEVLFHGALIGVALMNIAPFWRVRSENPAGWPGIGLFVAVAAFAALRVVAGMEGRTLWLVLLIIAAASGPFWFWRLTRTLFEDGFRPRAWHWGLLAALEALALARLALDASWAALALRVLAAGIVAHALWIAVRGMRDDLVEARLKSRMQVVLIAGFLALLTLARPALTIAAPRFADLLATPLIDIALIIAAGGVFFRLERELWPPRPPRTEQSAEPVDPDVPDLERLDALMTNEQVWREPGLTVAALAARARLPEYRLRRLILERRGARNFNAYLAEFRLAEAAKRLEDPADARAPVTTIAFDVGFASLGPFNRAFREKFGVTPTLYRKGERVKASPNP